jgi:hypothetical protein
MLRDREPPDAAIVPSMLAGARRSHGILRRRPIATSGMWFTEGLMAYLWTCSSTASDAARPASGDEWSPLPLVGAALALHPTVQLRRSAAEPDIWVVVGAASLRVNGEPLDAGIRVLRDRDELRAGSRRAFFSAESPVELVAFPAPDRAVLCPRCKLEIPPASPAVRCPQCRVWHHQSDDLPCWTYDRHCATCDRPSALDAGFRWTPEGL